MEKGHFGKYTGNARHSRKEEMIHDRELIFDAKKQLHNADKYYKKDSSSFQMQGDLDKDGKMSGYEANRQKKISEAMSDGPVKAMGDVGDVVRLETGDANRETPKSNGNKTPTQKTPSIISFGSSSKPITLGITGVNGATKQNNPMTSARTTSASTAATDESKSTSSYTTSGQGRRERRLGKAERKADLKKSQDKVVASRRLEKKASRIKNRAYVKGDRGATNQYKTTD